MTDPDLQYVHPQRYSLSNVVLDKLGIVVHDAETGDGAYDALRRVLLTPGDRIVPNSSPPRYYGSAYHAITNGIGGYVQDLPARAAPNAAPPVNQNFWHICMPGLARQTREEWLDTISFQHIRGVAHFIVDKGGVGGVPIQRASVETLRALVPAGKKVGYCGHWDINRAFDKTTHTDPGPNFPWDVLDAEIQRLLSPPAPQPVPKEDDEMTIISYFHDAVDATGKTITAPRGFIVTNGVTWRSVDSMGERDELVAAGAKDLTTGSGFPVNGHLFANGPK